MLANRNKHISVCVRGLGVLVGSKADRGSLAWTNVISNPSHYCHHKNSHYNKYFSYHRAKHPEAVICCQFYICSSLKCRIVKYVVMKRYYGEFWGIIFTTSLIQRFLMNKPQCKMISSACPSDQHVFFCLFFPF